MSHALRAPGTIAWHDLTVASAPAVAAFYRDVLGVVVDSVPMGEYVDFTLLPRPGADPIAGVCHARGQNAALPAVWLAYFVVRDLDVAMGVCRERGGRVIAGPTAVGAGAYAVVEDPAGAALALWADAQDARGGDGGAPAEPVGARVGARGGGAAEWVWGPGVDAVPLVESVVLASLLVASGGEGSVDGGELGTIMKSLQHRFRTVGADVRLEALARAVERFATDSVADVSEAVEHLGRALPPEARAAIFDDLYAVAEADGSVHTMEHTLLRHIAEAWGVGTNGDH